MRHITLSCITLVVSRMLIHNYKRKQQYCLILLQKKIQFSNKSLWPKIVNSFNSNLNHHRRFKPSISHFPTNWQISWHDLFFMKYICYPKMVKPPLTPKKMSLEWSSHNHSLQMVFALTKTPFYLEQGNRYGASCFTIS